MLPDSDVGVHSIAGQPVSLARKTLNILVCLLSLPLYWALTLGSAFPVTLDMLMTIALAELNRLNNEDRRRKCHALQTQVREKVDLEKQAPQGPNTDCMATVVGWREDPALFARALASYREADGCHFLLVGVDGDEEADREMVDVFERTYPHNSRVIHIPRPLGLIAEDVIAKTESLREQYGLPPSREACEEAALQHCISTARDILNSAGISPSALSSGAVQHLCLRQPHMHKKAIMFTSFIFSLVIADALDLEFLWSSDSDTLVYPTSLSATISTFAAWPRIGGASSGLVVHNGAESAVSQLAATVYWGELYLTRSTPAPPASSDCQSGPSSAFRLAALPAILVPWYMQTLAGKRMIINEDRHLTTNLLKRGWGVTFASDVLAATDTPATLTRWLKQQVRWARATHIESLLQPSVYVVSHPLLFFGMVKRQFGPIIAAVAVVWFLLVGRPLITMSWSDLAVRTLMGIAYNLLRNPQRLSVKEMAWVLPGMLFYYVPLPAVHCWSLMTLTADGWGTSMRAQGERAKQDALRTLWWEVGFFVIWMGVVAGVCVRLWAGVQELDDVWTLGCVLICMLLGSLAGWKATIGRWS